jgi:N-acetylglucosamine-6-phosphate deacetylase
MRVVGIICGTSEPSTVAIEGERIAAVSPAAPGDEDLRGTLGGAECLISPALFDIQVNGFRGHDVNGENASPDDVAAMVEALHGTGVGLCCPTVTTGPSEGMCGSLQAIAAACEDESIAATLVAIHLEGPYIAPEDGPRGAHPAEHVGVPDWDEFQRFQDAANGRIRIVTLAPELPGAIGFIEKLANEGIVPAIGHTGAADQDIRNAIRAGARLSTHLGNAAHAFLPRHPNYIWTQLAADRLCASIIPDGHHLAPSVVKCVIRSKGRDRTILVSDAVWCAGLEPGDYTAGGLAVELTQDGRVQLKGTPYLAGSALALHRGVVNAARFAGITLPQALQMATLNPAKLLGIDDRFGAVEPGKEASLLVFRWNAEAKAMEIRCVVVRGRVVHRAA